MVLSTFIVMLIVNPYPIKSCCIHSLSWDIEFLLCGIYFWNSIGKFNSWIIYYDLVSIFFLLFSHSSFSNVAVVYFTTCYSFYLYLYRVNSVKVMEYLRNSWAGDRKSEWSIWMVHSKVDIPHRYLKSGANKAFDLSVPGKASLSKKLSNDVNDLLLFNIMHILIFCASVSW